MDYSRRDFLRIAATGVTVAVGAPWLFSGAAHAAEELKGYPQEQADRIHDRETEEAIRRAGKTPEEVKAQVDRRIRELKAA